ncbi:MAG: hypothetical protein ACFCVC_09730 [Acidimicrobiia bacterium]
MTDDYSADGYTHHVIGAVHEVIIERDDPEVLARAVARELTDCEAMRIVVDLTELDDVTDAHLEALRPLALDSDRAAVRLREGAVEQIGAALGEIGIRDVITGSPAGGTGPTGLSNQPSG